MKQTLPRKNRAVFLDRDGVIVVEPPHYAHRIDQLKLISRASRAIKILNQKGFRTIVVSNQAGIARGYFKEEEARRFNKEMERRLRIQGAKIDAVYFCPHHPEAEEISYRRVCRCRKPNPGMLHAAAKKFEIDLARSFLVGDKLSDIKAGKRVGCKTILVRTGHGKTQVYMRKEETPDHVAPDLFGAVRFIT